MQLDAYLKGQVVAIGTPDDRADSGRRVRNSVILSVFGVAFIVAAYALSDQRDARGAVRPLLGFVMLGVPCLLLALASLRSGLSAAARLRRRLIRKYELGAGGRDPFTAETYAAAAAALRGFRPMSHEVAEKNFGADAVAVLVLTRTVDFMPKTRLWEKVVSIRSIEEDRPADERDDAEA